MVIVDRVRELVISVVDAESADLYDVEHNGGVLRVLVDAEGGIGIDDLKRISRALGRRLDEVDLMPGRYTLEVSSPGLERPLRTPEHFRGAVGERIKVKTMPTAAGSRRLAGALLTADDGCFDIDSDGQRHRLRYDEVARARTVFDWGPAPRRGSGRSSGRSLGSARSPGPAEAGRQGPCGSDHSTKTKTRTSREAPAS
ncbi:MAG: ribosome maturation factor RimP [Acidimicrobiaceae bacterium]|nr:ribosome maturation factor RimP [Acidimicrobiia bacterium]MCY4494798.1 ribosome maturation factor RimP [Acidimicrobiaceae bacterium]